jgi:hypothetical protein
MKRRLVRIKTEDQLLSSDWNKARIMRDEHAYIHKNTSILAITDTMFEFIGSVLLLEKDGDRYKHGIFVIDEEMIHEDLDPKDYPEYMI